MSKPPQDWKDWARHLRDTIPGDTSVSRYYDEAEEHNLDVFTTSNDEGTVAATIGLMEFDQSRNPDRQVYSEILMDVRGQNEFICNILSTIGFYIMKDGWKVAPGVVFEEMVAMYIPACEVRHVLFLPPFQWDDGMTKVALSSKTIYPLLAIPITNSEMELVRRDGSEALEDRWVAANCDVLQWNRKGAA
jgi:hypothetical protein